MERVTALLVPLILLSVCLTALIKRIDVFAALVKGAGEGLAVVARLVPTLVCLLCGVYMLRASGALDAIAHGMAPLLSLLHIPADCAPLMLLRPLSGSGALAAGSEIITEAGADTRIGRLAAVMLASSETTFYTIAVYFGGAGITKTRHAIPAALTAELAAFACAAFMIR